jgi:3',5'-cyclic AMP phosphodiesterase CpdA
MDDDQESFSAAERGLSAPLVSGANVTGSSACDNPLCKAEARLDKVRHWDGWSRVAPFLVTETETETSMTTNSVTKSTTTATTGTTTTATTTCMALEEGDDCYKEVLDVLYDLRDNPDSRDGLTKWSSFEEVQAWLQQNEGKSKCLDACECQVPPINSTCYSSLVYAMESGIREHPEWYPGLTEESSAFVFQEYLWKNANQTECLRPCKDFPLSDPSLFCWSVVRQWGYEADIIRAQLTAGAGIFSCDGFAVASEDEWSLGWGPGGRIGEVNTLSFAGAPVGVSKDGTAGNAELFMHAWDAILDRTLVLKFDWGIKVDPDAVVVADRLRDHVRDRTGSNVFVRNCHGRSNTFKMMFGSLEAISRGGLQVYKDGSYRCRNELSWYSWGEDLFLGNCLEHLGVGPMDDFSIISDGVCTGVNCNDGWSAAFHPFKSSDEWMNCWNTATGNLGGPPPPLP